MRILHITPFYEPAWAYGGIPRAVSSLARAQARIEGVEVEVVTTDVFDERGRCGEVRPGVHRFRNLSNAAAYRFMLLLPSGLRRFLDAHLASFDIVHLHGCRHLLNEIFVRRPNHPAYVLSAHGTFPRIESKIFLKRVWDGVFGSRVIDGAACVVALTEAEKQRLPEAVTGRVRILPNIVEDPATESVRPDCFSSLLQAGDLESPYILYLGKLTPRKRVDLLIRAFHTIRRPGLRLVIAGNDMGVGTSLQRLCRRLSIGHLVDFTGLLTGAARHSALSRAELLVYPGEHEVFGLAPFEGLLAGTVPVVSDDDGCGELIREGRCGYLFRCGNLQDLVRTLCEALDDRAARPAMIQSGRSFVSRFAPDAVARRSIDIYREALGQAPLGRS